MGSVLESAVAGHACPLPCCRDQVPLKGCCVPPEVLFSCSVCVCARVCSQPTPSSCPVLLCPVGDGGDVGKIETGPVGKPYSDLGTGQRSLVSLAGPFANFILSSLIFALILGVHGRPNLQVGVMSVADGGAAQAAGMEAGDSILEINGKKITNTGEVIVAIMLNPNEQMDFLVQRCHNGLHCTASPHRTSLRSGPTIDSPNEPDQLRISNIANLKSKSSDVKHTPTH